jgi:ABC-type transport system involved in cytochrome c biogenesis permease subunit
MEPKAPNNLPDSRQNPPIPEIERSLKSWMRWVRFWKVIHYVVGTGGTLLAAAVASKITLFEGIVLPWLATACVGLLTFAAPMKKAKVYFDAHTLVDDAYLRYLRTSQVSDWDVLNVFRDAQKLIGTSIAS